MTKCEWMRQDYVLGEGPFCAKPTDEKCPKNRCIFRTIKKKPKPKMVRIKAHFFKDASGVFVAFSSKANKKFKPCTILIEAKYLK
jgi:hypothetical protein